MDLTNVIASLGTGLSGYNQGIDIARRREQEDQANAYANRLRQSQTDALDRQDALRTDLDQLGQEFPDGVTDFPGAMKYAQGVAALQVKHGQLSGEQALTLQKNYQTLKDQGVADGYSKYVATGDPNQFVQAVNASADDQHKIDPASVQTVQRQTSQGIPYKAIVGKYADGKPMVFDPPQFAAVMGGGAISQLMAQDGATAAARRAAAIEGAKEQTELAKARISANTSLQVAHINADARTDGKDDADKSWGAKSKDFDAYVGGNVRTQVINPLTKQPAQKPTGEPIMQDDLPTQNVLRQIWTSNKASIQKDGSISGPQLAGQLTPLAQQIAAFNAAPDQQTQAKIAAGMYAYLNNNGMLFKASDNKNGDTKGVGISLGSANGKTLLGLPDNISAALANIDNAAKKAASAQKPRSAPTASAGTVQPAPVTAPQVHGQGQAQAAQIAARLGVAYPYQAATKDPNNPWQMAGSSKTIGSYNW